MQVPEVFLGGNTHREPSNKESEACPNFVNSGVEMPTAKTDEIFTSNLWKDILKEYEHLF